MEMYVRCQGSQRLMENVQFEVHSSWLPKYKDCSQWYTVFCSASSSMYWYPDKSELHNLFGNCPRTVCDAFSARNICVWPDVVKDDQQFRHFCCGTNSTKVSFQSPWCFSMLVRFNVVSLGKKFSRIKSFSFQTSCIVMVQKTVEINFIVSLCACVSILGIYWAQNLEETNSSPIAITLSLLTYRVGPSSSTYQPIFPFCLNYSEDDNCNNALKIFKHLQQITQLTPETKVS